MTISRPALRAGAFVSWMLALVFFASACGSSQAPAARALTPSELKALGRDRSRAADAMARIRVDRRKKEYGYTLDSAMRPRGEFLKLPASPPQFDAIHYHLNLAFPPESTANPRFAGEVLLTFRPLQADFRTLALDSAGLDIESVRLLPFEDRLTFQLSEDQLQITLDRGYQPSELITISIRYRWATQPNKGVYFRSRTGVTELESIYSQSEPEESRFWFPGHASPDDRATFSSTIIVPKPFSALSNGALIRVDDLGDAQAFHWRMRTPMVTYLFAVTAGKMGFYREFWKGIPLEYIGPPDDIQRVAYSLRNTPRMMSLFSAQTGIDYPYEKYAQAVVPQYPWGGMEHATATTLTDQTVHGPAEDAHSSSDSLVAHELAHQWFGDLVTCRSWDHLWLNEGFATYFEALYHESSQGRAALLRELAEAATWFRAEEANDPHPVVSPFYRETLDYYFDSRRYAKGAWVLHMLRNLLGDATFFNGIRLYTATHQGGLVTTEDFRKAMEKVSGRDLGWFFDQWLYKPGFPKFAVSWSYDSGNHLTRIQVKQAQDREPVPGSVIGSAPLYQGPIAVEIDGSVRVLDLRPEETQEFSIPTRKPPAYVTFNAENGWLAQVETTQSRKAWEAQLRSSLDPTGRIQAADALGDEGSLKSLRALADCAQLDPSPWVRRNCIESMVQENPDSDDDGDAKIPGELGSDPEAQRARGQALIEDTCLALAQSNQWEVRQAVAAALKHLPGDHEKVVAGLRRMALEDPSVVVAAEALKSLGSLTPAPQDALAFLTSQLSRRSFQDKLAEGSLKGLAALKDARALAPAEEHSSTRYEESVRRAAIGLLVAIGQADPSTLERASIALEAILLDEQSELRAIGISSLVKLKSKRSIPALRKMAESDSEPGLRERARVAIQEIEG